MRTIDFETEAIEGNPIVNPPEPVGVSIKKDYGPSVYHTGTPRELLYILSPIWYSGEDLLFHNAPFDLSVAEKWLGLGPPAWHRVHDTKFLIYLHDPHAKNVSLKPSAERILNIEPEERDELRAWILANIPNATPTNWGAFISLGPVELVSKYAQMDTDMTYQLFQYLYSRVSREAYDVERELQSYLVESTKGGIQLDRGRLESDLADAEAAQEECNQRIFKHLGTEFEITKGNQLADALEAAGEVTEWTLTPTGLRSTSRPNLITSIRTPSLVALLSYSGAMQTVISTFMRGWMNRSSMTGCLHPSWNQVRGDDDYGTRTGRLSCSGPNLQNVPTSFPFALPPGLPPVPNMRDYLIPEAGQVWSSRDFSAQEMRLLAHFEGGRLQQAFQQDPGLDPHEMVRWIIKEISGLDVTRKQVKGISFGMIYGMGVPSLSKTMGLDTFECGKLVEAYHMALPGVRVLQKVTKQRGKRRQPLRTIGGRKYFCEPSMMVEGSGKKSFEYKLLNYLIQGSAADQTKRALLDYFRNKPADESFLCTVHDEINISIDPGAEDSVLRHSMEQAAAVGLNVPMLTTLQQGPTWGSIK